ncbi:hypothetical protein Q3G72_024427 [Acer saccharum]|nr:hypothetical protein Q3G72_024427 [Acer saccharum]
MFALIVAMTSLAGNVSAGGRSVGRWKPPDERGYKLNTDAAVDSVNGRVGFGIVIRDSAGSVLAASAQRMDFDYSPRVAEVLALLRGSSLVQEAGGQEAVAQSRCHPGKILRRARSRRSKPPSSRRDPLVGKKPPQKPPSSRQDLSAGIKPSCMPTTNSEKLQFD